MKISVILILFISMACQPKNKSDRGMENNQFEQQLLDIGYKQLFMHADDSKLKKIWNKGENKTELLNIITTDKSSDHGIFLAAEVLRHFQIPFKEKHYEELAKAYVYALEYSDLYKDDFIHLNGNLWGFLYELDDVGFLGKQLLEFGEPAIPFLIMLLNDEGKILYEGGQDASMGNSYQYRIKDVAAFYLSKIVGKSIQFHQEIKDRDAEIEHFKKLLKNEKKSPD